MKIGITYFYQVRFFKPHQIPVSTAVWDPRWYSNGGPRKDQKTGVLLGLRIPELNPQSLKAEGCPCPERSGWPCEFLNSYMAGLKALDFQEIIQRLEIFGKAYTAAGGKEEPEVYLVVHEAPGNPCSERGPLMEWFSENGVNLEEYERL